MESIGERVRAERLARGMGLREVARHALIAPAFLTDIEAGRRNPSAKVMSRLATVLGVPLAELEALDPRITPEVRQ